MDSFASRLAVSVAFGLLGSGCSAVEPEQALAVTTDSTEYQLQYGSGYYRATIEVRIENVLDRTLYLHRTCGYGDDPSVRLRRTPADTTTVRLYVGGNVCITAPARPPIPLAPGETRVDRLVVESHGYLPPVEPPSKMATRTGRFVLAYDVQWTDEVGEWAPVDPLPLELTESNSFRVVAPPLDW